jgi:hypothetical protein
MLRPPDSTTASASGRSAAASATSQDTSGVVGMGAMIAQHE